jgi:hypothetical protein
MLQYFIFSVVSHWIREVRVSGQLYVSTFQWWRCYGDINELTVTWYHHDKSACDSVVINLWLERSYCRLFPFLLHIPKHFFNLTRSQLSSLNVENMSPDFQVWLQRVSLRVSGLYAANFQFPQEQSFALSYIYIENMKISTPWLYSGSELNRPSDCRLSDKLVPTFCE